MPVIPALGRQRQGDCEFDANAGCIASSRPSWVTESLSQPALHSKTLSQKGKKNFKIK
jgi:hypothetical protein